ncbi:MAG TPA: sodium:solute symporter [Planctomycetota bacterium]|nr:sodium:solute symporter [Planctomycetota bacterium]
MVFGGLDYAVLAGYFVLCAAVGGWAGRGQKNAGEFFKGGGAIPTWAVCLSILASETSALTFCGVPGQAYGGDHTYFQFVVGNLAGRLLVAFLFIPAFYIAGVTSVYEFLGLRFGPATRATASVLFLVTRILASGVRLTAAAIIVEAVTGWSFNGCVVAFTLITVAYSVYGGIKSIIWTDVLQFFLFIGGASLALVLILGDVGSAGFHRAVDGTSKLRMVNPTLSLDQTYTLLTAVVCGPILTFATHGTDQDLVQRMLTCKGSRQGAMSVVFSGLISIPLVLLFLFIGTSLYAFYGQHPDLKAALPLKQDQIFPHFIVHQLPVGIRGLVIAAVFAAAMSTTSSAIGALALVAVVDGLQRFRPGLRDPASDLRRSRLMTAVMGVLLIVVAIGFERVRSLLDTGLEVMTYAYGALLGVFVLGRVTTSRGSDRANVVAMLASVAIVVSVKFGVNRDRVVVAWPWFTVIGFVATTGIGVLFPTAATTSSYRGASAPPR